MARKVVVTDEGLKKLQEELNELKTVRRKEITEKIKVARGFGDLSENSEYDDAKNEQALVENRIAELEEQIKDATVINDEEISTEVINIGSKVKVYDKEYDEEYNELLSGYVEYYLEKHADEFEKFEGAEYDEQLKILTDEIKGIYGPTINYNVYKNILLRKMQNDTEFVTIK